MPTGHDAPWRGRRTTRTSSAKYLPPNCAPMPVFCAASSSAFSSSTSRKAWPCLLPVVGRSSSAFAEASFTVLRHASAEVPPITNARWYGGHAAVPSVRIFSERNLTRLAGFSSAFVSWNRYVLFAEPPPLAIIRKWYSIAVRRVDVDLRRQVRAGVGLVVHRQRHGLRVAQVLLRVGLEDAAGEVLGVAAARPHALALLADDRRGAGVLAHRQHEAGGDLGVAQQRERDAAVVRRGLGVVEDRGDLRQVRGPVEEGDVAEGLASDERQRLGRDLEDLLALERRDRDEVGRDLAVRRSRPRPGGTAPGSGTRAW